MYDQIIGIINYTNIHIFGITCALAWQLPHDSVFAKKHHTHPMHNENITITGKNSNETKSDAKKNGTKRIDLLHFNTYYDRNNYHKHEMNDAYYNYLELKAKPSVERSNNNRRSQSNLRNKQRRINHRIYPALRMRRSIDTHDQNVDIHNIDPEVRSFLEHHRDTRFDLYKSVEKYLEV